jgi:tRNA(adenine34) deaminase
VAVSAVVAALDLERFMREALAEAEAAGRAGDLPIGAVVVHDGDVIARGRSRNRSTSSQLAHAELEALLALRGEEWAGDNPNTVLFTTVEPCPMCLGALVMADVPHLVFGSHDAIVDAKLIADVPYVRNHLETYLGGILEEESQAIIGRYDPTLLGYILTGRTGRKPKN